MTHRPKEPKIRLEYRSMLFRKQLLARYPEWEQFAGSVEVYEADFVVRYFQVLVPFADARVTDPLLIQVKPQEIYLGWGKSWHDHVIQGRRDFVYRVPDQSLEDHHEDALRFIDLVTSEDFLFGVVYKDGVRIRDWASPVTLIRADDLEPKEGFQTEIYSLRGIHDRVI